MNHPQNSSKNFARIFEKIRVQPRSAAVTAIPSRETAR